jgi:AraC family transcriptional regulator, transcriptional activator of pobA
MQKSTLIPLWESKKMSYNHFGMAQEYPHFASFEHLFHINRLEDYQDKIQFPLPPHRKQVYDFLFLTKGITQRSKALNPYRIGQNTFFFLPAFQITNHDFMSEDIEGFYCHFNFDIFTNHLLQHNILQNFPFLQFISNPLVEIEESAKTNILHIFKRLESEYQRMSDVGFGVSQSSNRNLKSEIQNPKPDLDIIIIYLLALFTEVNRFYTPSVLQKKTTALMITQQFKDALSNHIYEKRLVSEYADLLMVSPNHLNKCVKKATGFSAQDLLNEMIILEAKVLLKQTDYPINEIAHKLSQQNHSDFSRFFKSKTGITPKEYKQQ